MIAIWERIGLVRPLLMPGGAMALSLAILVAAGMAPLGAYWDARQQETAHRLCWDELAGLRTKRVEQGNAPGIHPIRWADLSQLRQADGTVEIADYPGTKGALKTIVITTQWTDFRGRIVETQITSLLRTKDPIGRVLGPITHNALTAQTQEEHP